MHEDLEMAVDNQECAKDALALRQLVKYLTALIAFAAEEVATQTCLVVCHKCLVRLNARPYLSARQQYPLIEAPFCLRARRNSSLIRRVL